MIFQKNRHFRVFTWIVISLVLFWLLFNLPLPYYIQKPGGALDVRQVMTVNGESDQQPGSYNLVYVRVEEATPFSILVAQFDPNQTVQPKEQVQGKQSDQEYQQLNLIYMASSQNQASYQGLTLAGREAKIDYLGVYVLSLSENSTFKGVLDVGDTVTGVNGKSFSNSKDLVDYVSKLPLDSTVEISYQTTDRKTHQAKGKVINIGGGRHGIGISLVEHNVITSKDKVEFQTDGIGGPSAGLMFTLSIYTQLKEPGLRNGRIIAGTGTIESDGSVGDIGGIDKKVLSADRAGASIFFAPNNPVDASYKKSHPEAKTNYEEAVESVKRNHLSIKVVPVSKVQDAINYLKANP